MWGRGDTARGQRDMGTMGWGDGDSSYCAHGRGPVAQGWVQGLRVRAQPLQLFAHFHPFFPQDGWDSRGHDSMGVTLAVGMRDRGG